MATRWHHLHYLETWLPGSAICISFQSGHLVAPLAWSHWTPCTDGSDENVGQPNCPSLQGIYSYCIQMAVQQGREAFSQTGITLHCPLQCIGHNSKYLGLPVDTDCHTKSWWTRGSHPHSFYTHPSTQVKRKMKHCTRLLCTVIPNEREK